MNTLIYINYLNLLKLIINNFNIKKNIFCLQILKSFIFQNFNSN